MKRILYAVLFLAASPAAAAPLDQKEKAEGFVSLFNGKDFSGWRFEKGSAATKLPDNWKVEDGVIKLSGGSKPHLASQWDYVDFDVRFQWRAVKDNYNSGFYIRSGRMVGANQINLARGGPGGFLGGKLRGGKPVPKLQKPPREWNHWRVLVQGDTVTFWCNDQLAWKGVEFGSARGYLGLQAEGFPMEFRNLRIKELGYEPLNDLGAWKSDGRWKADGDGFISTGVPARLELAKPIGSEYTLRLEWRADRDARGAVALDGAPLPLSGPTAKSKLKPNPAGEWNYLELRVHDAQVDVWLNGESARNVAALPDGKGSPALLVEAGKIQFRNVRIARSRR